MLKIESDLTEAAHVLYLRQQSKEEELEKELLILFKNDLYGKISTELHRFLDIGREETTYAEKIAKTIIRILISDTRSAGNLEFDIDTQAIRFSDIENELRATIFKISGLRIQVHHSVGTVTLAFSNFGSSNQ